jgi:Flp pilus assembly CpaF family ATPase
MATIHASSPEGALRAFYQNLAQQNPGIDAEAAIDIIASAFGRVVQIDRLGTQRVVTAIDIPHLVRAAVASAEA